MSKKAKKPSTTPPTKAKSAQKKTKPVAEAKQPEDQSSPLKTGLASVAATPGKTSKLNAITELLMRPEGATIDDMIAVTDWQKHTVRAALSHALAKKRGYQIVSEKPVGGQRSYKITGISRGDQPSSKDDH